MTSQMRRVALLSLLLTLFLGSGMAAAEKKLTRKERAAKNKQDAENYAEARRKGVDEVSHTAEAAALRKYQLRKKKRKGLIRKREADLASVLFPGVTPELYNPGEDVQMFTDLVNSKKTQVPFEFYDLPGCKAPDRLVSKRKKQRKNLGARLQGLELKPAPYPMKIQTNVGCTPLCQNNIKAKKLRWLRKLVERQYRIHMTFDSLPVLMRSRELNYAVRGYPIGFKAPPSYTGRSISVCTISHESYYVGFGTHNPPLKHILLIIVENP